MLEDEIDEENVEVKFTLVFYEDDSDVNLEYIEVVIRRKTSDVNSLQMIHNGDTSEELIGGKVSVNENRNFECEYDNTSEYSESDEGLITPESSNEDDIVLRKRKRKSNNLVHNPS